MAANKGAGADGARDNSKAVPPPASGSVWSTPGAESQPSGETKPQATAAYFGPKLGLPKEFGRYRLQKALGGGGMGSVYLVTNTELQRDEALKVPHFQTADDPDVRERFLREARAAAALDHPNLCPVYDVGVLDGIYYLTMRYLKGKLLTDHCGAAQPPRKAVEITAKLAHALAAAHARGVIHRDLKPNNIMMCPGLGPVVMDFGLAKQKQGESQKLTQSGATLGTPAYMPPEQVLGDLERIGPASDVYSLGVILFELLTGTLPFRGKTAGEVYGKILHTEAPAPSSLRPELNPALDAVCLKALAKTPEGRYASMKAFAALIDFLKTTPASEGAGALKETRPGTAAIFDAPTVAPGQTAVPTPRPGKRDNVDWPVDVTPVQAAAPTNPPPGRTTNAAPQAGRTQSPLRKTARTQRAEAVVEDDETRGGWTAGGVLGMLALILLMLSALGGVGYLVYLVSQNKAAPSSGPVASVTLVASPPKENTSENPKEEAPKKAPSRDEIVNSDPPKTEPTKVDSTPKTDPHGTGRPLKADPVLKTEPLPVVSGPRTVQPIAVKTEDVDAAVLLNEDFKEVEVGGRPKDWDGDAFAVQKEDDVSCLEVTNETPDQYYVRLPKVFIKGDFVLESEFRLGGLRNNSPHRLLLELRSRSSTPLLVWVSPLGVVDLEGARKEAKQIVPQTTVHFRFTRKGDVYNVSINGEVVVGKTIPNKGAFEEIRIGLAGGKDIIRSRIYSVKITSLEKDLPKAVGGDSLPGIREDFRNAAAGSLPAGWTASKAANIAVQKSGDKADLELVSPALLGDVVTLPKIELDGDFYVDVTFQLIDPLTEVQMVFKGTRTKPLGIQLGYNGAVTLVGLPRSDGSKSWVANGPNVVRLERSGKDAGYVVKLNGATVGTAPLAVAPGPFNKVDLYLLIKDAKKRSPQVTSVQVVPLEEAP